MAKSKNIKRTIAIVDNTDYFELSESIGVDTLVNKNFWQLMKFSGLLEREMFLNLTS